MISRRTLKIYRLAINYSHFSGSTPYYWTSNGNEPIQVDNSIFTTYRWYSTIGFSILSTFIVGLSYAFYLHEFGFNLNKMRNIFQFVVFFTCALSNVFLLSLFFKKREFANTLNQILHFYQNSYERFARGQRFGSDYSAIFVALNWSSGILMPIFLNALSLKKCQFHIFAQAFPFLCSEPGEDDDCYTAVLALLGKVLLYFLQWQFLTHAIMSGCLFVAIINTFWLHGLQLSSGMRMVEYRTLGRILNYFDFHASMLVLIGRVNECYGCIAYPAYKAVFMAVFIMSANGVLRVRTSSSAEPILIGLLISVLNICVMDYFISQASWTLGNRFVRITAALHLSSKNKFLRQRLTVNKKELVVSFGCFGKLDREMFVRLGELLMMQTLDVLLM